MRTVLFSFLIVAALDSSTAIAQQGDRARLLGSWSLVSVESRSADGAVTYPYGEDPQGRLMYDASGTMMVQLMRKDRPMLDIEKAATADEIKAAYQSSFSYFGTFDVDEQGHIVTHSLQGCSRPNWTGTVRRRYYEFQDGRLILKTSPKLSGGKEGTTVLVWQRQEPISKSKASR